MEESLELWVKPLGEALQLSVFVMIIMMLMEYFSLKKQQKKYKKAEGNLELGTQSGEKKWKNVLYGALLGCIPGCVGGFAAMSFYTHGLWSFGAVLAASFSALGDDAFRMWALMPRTYLLLSLALCVLGFVVGLCIDRMPYFARFHTHSAHHLHCHEDDVCANPWLSHRFGKKEWSLGRVLIVAGIVLYIYSLILGLGHEHGVGETCGHTENGLFLIISLLALWIVMVSDEHFIQDHLWKHVLKEHFWSIFIWTLGTLYVLIAWKVWIAPMGWEIEPFSRTLLLLVAAVLIGWIPYSGPHFLFIQLAAASCIPFTVFLANSIVQDGHTSLILISESRKQFIWLKGIKSVLALAIGLLGFCMGF